MVGWARLNNIQGAAGTEIIVKFGERLNPDGTVYTENLRGAKSTDKYIMKGGLPENMGTAFYISRLSVCGNNRFSQEFRIRIP